MEERKLEERKLEFTCNLKGANLSQKLFFEAIILPEIFSVLCNYVGDLTELGTYEN